MTKIFGIGLNKTGTTSLSRAVEVLGFRSCHAGGSPDLTARIEHALAADLPMFEYTPELADFDAFFDLRAIERNFEICDAQWPGSKFILHTRELAPWLDSREAHVRRNQTAADQDSYRGGWLEVDRVRWTDEYRDHHRRVREHFAGRAGDLLEIDVSEGDGWERLAPFLGCPIPDVPFPRLNTSKDAGAGVVRRSIGRARRVLRPDRR